MADAKDPDVQRELEFQDLCQQAMRKAMRETECFIWRFFVGGLVIYLVVRMFIQ